MISNSCGSKIPAARLRFLQGSFAMHSRSFYLLRRYKGLFLPHHHFRQGPIMLPKLLLASLAGRLLIAWICSQTGLTYGSQCTGVSQVNFIQLNASSKCAVLDRAQIDLTTAWCTDSACGKKLSLLVILAITGFYCKKTIIPKGIFTWELLVTLLDGGKVTQGL